MSLKALTFLVATAQAIPTPAAPITHVSSKHGLQAPHMLEARKDCGLVGDYFNPTVDDWKNANTDAFMHDWIANNQESIKNHSYGFASAYGEFAAGNPDFECLDDGSVGCTTDNVCANPRMNGHGNETEEVYYLYKGIEGLHSYFMGVSQSFQVAGLLGALQTDDWTRTFYKKKDGSDADSEADQKGILALKEVLNALAMVVAIGAAFVTGPAGAAVAAGVVSAVAGGAVGATNLAIPAAGSDDSNFKHAADVGAAIGRVVHDSMTSLINNNNKLMRGQTIDPDSTGIETYLGGGYFIDSSYDKAGAIDTMGAMIQGMSVNSLWRQNKIFIMGGTPCDDPNNGGLGTGPEQYSFCDGSNKKWYIYFWQANDVVSLTKHQWGWTAMPPGADKLGDTFKGLTIQDVISSSVDSYNVAKFGYDNNKQTERVMSALADGWADPRQKGPSFEGVFTIPVCDVGPTASQNFPNKQYIMQDYGHDSRPCWCGPVCGNDAQTTKDFIHAALMDGFESPKQCCPDDTNFGY